MRSGMWIDLAALAIFVVFVTLGAVRGTLLGLVHTITIVASYGAALLAATRLAEPASHVLGVRPLFAGAVAGMVAFGVAWVLVGIAGRLVVHRAERKRAGRPRSAADRLGGAAIGAVHGAVLALLVGWLGLWLEAALQARSMPAMQAMQESAPPAPSPAREASRAVARSVASAAMGEGTGARVGVNLIASPAETMAGVRRVLENPRIRTLQEDRLFWQHVSSGAVDAALNQASFLGIAYDDTLRGQLADLGLVGEAARGDARLFRNSCHDALARVAPALRDLREDPQVHALLADEGIQRALSEGDTVAMLANPQFRSLVDRVVSRVEPPGPASPAPDDDAGF